MSTIAAISTPNAVGGVSMIRISGDNAKVIASKVFKPAGNKNICQMKGYTAAYGYILNDEKRIDDGIILNFNSPNSYTGEDVCEITCHGGVYITKEVLAACIKAGAEPAAPGEFTKRALLNGKMSLTEAEAVIDVINAQNEQYLSCSNAQKEGSLYKKINEISELILSISVKICAWLDYPLETEDEFDESSIIADLTACNTALDTLLKSYDIGKVLREGIPTAIVGRPNAGKSTIMNLLAGEEKSIVTNIEGTTRDIVEETVNIGEVCLRVSDCAGIRETDDVVEKIGVEKMLLRLQNSTLVFAVFDGNKPLSEEDFRLISHIKNKNTLCIINKSDLETKIDIKFLEKKFKNTIIISATEQESLQKIIKKITENLNLKSLDMSAGFLANERQRSCVLKAKEAVDRAILGIKNGITLDATGIMLEAALNPLYELSGKNVSETVISEVFKRFCVGK